MDVARRSVCYNNPNLYYLRLVSRPKLPPQQVAEPDRKHVAQVKGFGKVDYFGGTARPVSSNVSG
jgi:hypothetical protein